MPNENKKIERQNSQSSVAMATFGLFSEPNHQVTPAKKRLSPEEKWLIKDLKNRSRAMVIEQLTTAEGSPSKQEVEACLDVLIEDYYQKGIIQKIMADYVQKKIEEERKAFIKE